MKIPKGWFRVRTGARARFGDRASNTSNPGWVELVKQEDLTFPIQADEVVIRRRAKKRTP